MKWSKWLENWDMTSLKIKASFLEMEWKPAAPSMLRGGAGGGGRGGRGAFAAASSPARLARRTAAACAGTSVSPRPPPLVYRVRALPESLEGFEIADVVRCRKRALELCAHPLPMFCALDQIREQFCSTGFASVAYEGMVLDLP